MRERWNQYLECELIYRHAGECPLWGAHITLLDAISIIEDDFRAFVEAIREVLSRHLPIAVGHPYVKKWDDDVFLRWKDKEQRDKLKQLRVELATGAHRFAVTERLDWEKVNDVERLLEAHGTERAPAESFREGLRSLKADMAERWPELLYAPNVPLEWYIAARTKGPLVESKMPFSPSPHMSVATGVSGDTETGYSAPEVGDYILNHLPSNPEFEPLLDPDVTHLFDSASVVEPVSPDRAIEITVLDRITNAPRRERHQPWVAAREFPRARPGLGREPFRTKRCFASGHAGRSSTEM